MHHKRGRAKNARAGCLMCKPHKANGWAPKHRNMKWGNFRRFAAGSDQLRAAGLAVAGKRDDRPPE